MSTIPLPENPSLEHLRGQARRLQRAARAGSAEAVALVAEHHPHPPARSDLPTLSLSAAQTTLARRYGFADWAALRRHVEVIGARSWVLPEPAATETGAERFLRLVSLNFERDDPGRRAEAATLIAEHPELPSTSVAVAAVAADEQQVGRLLAADPVAATRPVGPFGWSPLLYLAYGRLAPAATLEATLATTRRLLEAGADPNDGRFFLGLPTPFTVLTGLFGSDSPDQPEHPHAVALARLLLEAGADPNDGQTLYNRMFGPADDHLVVLFEHGLGQGDGGPWRRLLGEQVESPQTMLGSLLDWAVSHDQRDRVALLAEHGVDVLGSVTVPRRSSRDELTPLEVAVLNGNLELADQLRALGAQDPPPNPARAFVSAALAGDALGAEAVPAEVVDAVRAARPGLVVWAAGRQRVDAVELLLAYGFDVNALGRADTPREQPWQTALHTAVERSDLELARRLLALGADPDRRDRRFDGTPLDWARHLSRPELVALLEPLTRADPPVSSDDPAPGTGAR